MERNLDTLKVTFAEAGSALNEAMQGGRLAELQGLSDKVIPPMQQMTQTVVSGRFLYSWMIVMVVTFAEAYLEDVFSILITQGLSTSALPAELQTEIAKKWVKEAMRRGRASEWIKHLGKFGISGFPPELPSQLQPIWQKRHTFVHTAEPSMTNAAPQEFLEATKRITSFIEKIDAQLLTLCPYTQAV